MAEHKLSTECVGLHLRGSDHLRPRNKPHSGAEKTLLQTAMAAVEQVVVRGGQRCLFLATGDLAFRKAIANHPGIKQAAVRLLHFGTLGPPQSHPANAREHGKKALPNRRQGPLGNAAVDVVLLGRCRHLITTGSSSFSRWAQMLWSERTSSVMSKSSSSAACHGGSAAGKSTTHSSQEVLAGAGLLRPSPEICGDWPRWDSADLARCPRHGQVAGYDIPEWGARDCLCAFDPEA